MPPPGLGGASAATVGSGSFPTTTTSMDGPTPTSTTSGQRPAKRGKMQAGPKSHSRSYPRGVGLDFRKLAGLTLVSYIDHHGVKVRAEAPPSELAVAVARHFESMEVEEDACIGGFLERLEVGMSSTALTNYARATQHFDCVSANNKNKRKRTKWAARPGEQVAAKVTRTDENGSWILASVQRFYADTETYDVQDEDDTSKLIRLPWSHVMRLSTGAEGCFTKGADCMAIFPETTSFYKAKVSKSPVWKLDHHHHGHGHGHSQSATSGATAAGATGTGAAAGTSTGGPSSAPNPAAPTTTSSGGGIPTVKEIIVKFEDDEDVSGKTPHRRVPSRYVIPVPSQYFYDESEDVDLTPPGTAK